MTASRQGGSTQLEFVSEPPFGDATDPHLGADGTILGLGIPVPATDTLLTILEVTASTSAPPDVGDEFTISLVPSSGLGSLSTYFNADAIGLFPIDYSSYSGTVTITPEPGTFSIFLVLAGLGSTAGIIRRVRPRNPAKP